MFLDRPRAAFYFPSLRLIILIMSPVALPPFTSAAKPFCLNSLTIASLGLTALSLSIEAPAAVATLIAPASSVDKKPLGPLTNLRLTPSCPADCEKFTRAVPPAANSPATVEPAGPEFKARRRVLADPADA